MQTKKLQLLPGEELTGDGACVYITLPGKVQWAHDAVQADLVQMQSYPEAYAVQLAEEPNLPPGSTEATYNSEFQEFFSIVISPTEGQTIFFYIERETKR